MSSDNAEVCMKCGSENITWFAPSPLWNAVMRDPYLESIVCPVCFVKYSEQKLGKRTAWSLTPEVIDGEEFWIPIEEKLDGGWR